MDNQVNKTSSRKKFLFLGLSAVTLFSVFRFSGPKERKKNTVKLLSQEGKLVEIDQDLVKGNKKKISDAELRSWIKK